MSSMQESLCRWIMLGFFLAVPLTTLACSSSEAESSDRLESPTRVPSPILSPAPPATMPPQIAALPNIFAHISGAYSVRYPDNWHIATEGNTVIGSVEIANTRSALLGDPTHSDELHVRIEWSPATELVASIVPPDVGPLTLLSTIIDEWEVNSDSRAQFVEPFAIMVGDHQAARVNGVTIGENDTQLNTVLIVIDYGDGVAGYVTVTTPGELEAFEPLLTDIIGSGAYGGPPAIVEIPLEDLIQPLIEVSHLQAVRGVIITREGSRFLSWSSDTSVAVRDIQDGDLLQEFYLPAPITTIALSTDEQGLLIQPEGEAISLWNVDTGELRYTFQANRANSPLEGFSWSPDNAYLLGWAVNYASGASFAAIWNVRDTDDSDDEPIFPIETYRPHVHSQTSVGVWNHASTQFVMIDTSTQAQVTNLTDETETIALNHDDKIFGGAWRSDDEEIITWSQDQSVRVWDSASGELIRLLPHERPVRGAIWRDDDREILSWQVQSTSMVWDATTGTKQFELDTGSATGGAAWSPSSTYIITWSHPDVRVPIVRVWDAATGDLLFEAAGQNSLGEDAFSPDERHIATWSDDGIISVWNITSRQWDFIMWHDGVQGVRWSPDGSRLVSWSSDGTIRVWDANPDVDYSSLTRH